MLELDDELIESVSGGYNIDDLTREEFEELERRTTLLMDMQLKKRNNDPSYNEEEYYYLYNDVMELNRQYKAKYGY